MIRDPYSILGIPRSATDDEVKKAYRTLSRKYHPDANINNPNKEKAESMFKDVQQAYQQIMDERTKGYSGNDNGYGYGDFWGFGGFTQNQERRTEYEDDDTRYMKAVKNYINSGSYREAYNLLQSIGSRDAQWYYFSGIANAGMGNNVTAKEHAHKAVELEPGNISYQRLLQQLEGGGSWYADRSSMYGNPKMSSTKCCARVVMFYLICSLCSGGSGLCCNSGYGPSYYNGYNSYNNDSSGVNNGNGNDSSDQTIN